jgi:hypothetical protein
LGRLGFRIPEGAESVKFSLKTHRQTKGEEHPTTQKRSVSAKFITPKDIQKLPKFGDFKQFSRVFAHFP